eukprot:Ihof_evm4s144 gene=Ihof_evmTU4s144
MSKMMVFGLCAAAAIVAGFLALDHVRRSDPEYKDKIKEKRKQLKEKSQQARDQQAKAAEAEAALQAQQAGVAAQQQKLVMELEEGQKAYAEKDLESAAMHFANAVRISDSPMDIAMFLKQNLETSVFELMMKFLDPEVFRDKYFDTFPGATSGLLIKPVEGEKQRTVFATKDFKEGDVIASETPFAGSLLAEYMDGTHCAFCFTAITGTPVHASGEDGEVYCRAECKETAHQCYWRLFADHKVYSSIKASCLTNGVETFMVGKLLSKVFTPGSLADLTADVAHLHFIEPLPTIDDSMKKECENLKALLKGGIDSIEQLVNDESYVAMVGKVRTNQVTVTIDDKPVGLAVYLIGSYINHSCVPNMKIAFQEGNHKISYIATRDIKQGDELTRSYIDVMGKSVADRKAALEMYKFTCDCTACTK